MEQTKTVHHAKGVLQDRWCLWERQQSSTYSSEGLNNIIKIDGLKHFCRFWNKTPHSEISKFLQLKEDEIVKVKLMWNGEFKEMSMDCFMFFRDGIRPEWEDPRNKDGGHWLHQIQYPHAKHLYTKQVDTLWNYLIFDLIGESWPHSERICGVRLLNKVKNKEIYLKIEVWLDFREDDHNPDLFSTKDEQNKVLADIRNAFAQTIAKANEDSKQKEFGTVANSKGRLEIQDLKFENHHSKGGNTGHAYPKSGGGGGRQGGYRDNRRN